MAASPAASLSPFFFATSVSGGGDDDDEFGDFEFAPPPPPLNLQPIVVTTNAIDEDEWGDFVESPVHFNPRSDAEENLWERPRGAIPLSIFGEEEVEEVVGSGVSDAKDPFFLSKGDGGVDSSGKGPTFEKKGLGGVEIRDLLYDLYGQVDRVEGNGVSSENGGGVVVVEEEDEFDDGGWEFKGAVEDGRSGESVVGFVQVANKENAEESLGFVVNTPGETLVNKDAERDAFAGAYDLVSGITHASDGDGGYITGNGLVSNLANGKASFKRNEVMGTILEVEAADFFQWEQEGGKDNALLNVTQDSNNSAQKFQELGDLWGSHMEDVTVANVSNGKHNLDGLLDTENDFFAFEDTSVKSGTENITVNHPPSPNSLLLDLYGDQGQPYSFDFKNSNEDVTGLANELYFDQMSSGSNLQDGHMLGMNGFFKGVGDQTLEHVDPHQVHAESEDETFKGFYSKLKDASHLLVLHHVGNLKKAHEFAELSNDKTKAKDLQLRIQVTFEKLQLRVEDSCCAEDECCISQVHSSQLLEHLEHLKFHALEMEYSLSDKIKLAKDDLASAIQLLEHADVILHILELGHSRDQDYIIAWSKILGVCEQELQHCATILAQSLQNGVHEKILSQAKGYNFFLALGEIYRVAEILKITLSVYKPWILSNAAGSKDPLATVKRCQKFWMEAGVREALEGVLNHANSEIVEKIKMIFKSIDLIRNSNVVAIQSHISSQKMPVCHLSLLPLSTFPDMEVVVWNGENYLVKLANLWANRISIDPLKIPHYIM